MTDAAKAAGVNRSTLWRWLNKDAEFQSTMNSYKREAFDQLSMRTTALASLAISAVESALRGGDEKASIAVLRGLGLLNDVRVEPPTDACMSFGCVRSGGRLRAHNRRRRSAGLHVAHETVLTVHGASCSTKTANLLKSL